MTSQRKVVERLCCISVRQNSVNTIANTCRTIHRDCQPKISEICDFGDFRQLIVPPELVTAKPGRTMIHPRRWLITKVMNASRPLLLPLKRENLVALVLWYCIRSSGLGTAAKDKHILLLLCRLLLLLNG